jgi:hypothetical protein
MVRITNTKSRKLVELKKEFKANNMFSVNNNGKYVVYSYGKHFPIFANVNGKWYENADKYSITTSKHTSQARPYNENIEKVNLQKMLELTEYNQI